MSRKNGCPTNIRDWQVDVLNPASTRLDPDWVRVKGNESLTTGYDSDTEDGSSPESAYSENYKTKINGSHSLECKRVVDPVTGDRDPGQSILDDYMHKVGCDGDGTIRMIDPVGRAVVYDFIVTSNETSVDETAESVSWDMDVVGEPEEQLYMQATGVSIMDGASPVTTLSLGAGETKTLTVKIAPEGASNQRFGVASFDPARVQVRNVDGMTFDVVGRQAAAAVKIAVTTKNNSLRAEVAVTVTA